MYNIFVGVICVSSILPCLKNKQKSFVEMFIVDIIIRVWKHIEFWTEFGRMLNKLFVQFLTFWLLLMPDS